MNFFQEMKERVTARQVAERYGLKEKAVELIKNIKNLSTGKLLTLSVP